jgi:hypothetical protein
LQPQTQPPAPKPKPKKVFCCFSSEKKTFVSTRMDLAGTGEPKVIGGNLHKNAAPVTAITAATSGRP